MIDEYVGYSECISMCVRVCLLSLDAFQSPGCLEIGAFALALEQSQGKADEGEDAQKETPDRWSGGRAVYMRRVILPLTASIKPSNHPNHLAWDCPALPLITISYKSHHSYKS